MFDRPPQDSFTIEPGRVGLEVELLLPESFPCAVPELLLDEYFFEEDMAVGFEMFQGFDVLCE